jgi:hypothetical protein
LTGAYYFVDIFYFAFASFFGKPTALSKALASLAFLTKKDASHSYQLWDQLLRKSFSFYCYFYFLLRAYHKSWLLCVQHGYRCSANKMPCLE